LYRYNAMAYRTVGTGGAKVRAGMAPPMRIAFDGPDVDKSLPRPTPAAAADDAPASAGRARRFKTK
jgi:hypothetical protein